MNEAIERAAWLFVTLPEQYLLAVAAPIRDTYGVPVFGTACLLAGMAIALVQRERGLVIFWLPVALCQGLVTAAGALLGLMVGQLLNAVLVGFLVLQVLLIGYLIYRSAGARLAAVLLGLFTATYSVFAAFVAGMAFANDWL